MSSSSTRSTASSPGRYDVEQFLARVQAHDAAPLSMLTGGIHLHTLRCPDAAACERACAALKAAGLLLDD